MSPLLSVRKVLWNSLLKTWEFFPESPRMQWKFICFKWKSLLAALNIPCCCECYMCWILSSWTNTFHNCWMLLPVRLFKWQQQIRAAATEVCCNAIDNQIHLSMCVSPAWMFAQLCQQECIADQVCSWLSSFLNSHCSSSVVCVITCFNSSELTFSLTVSFSTFLQWDDGLLSIQWLKIVDICYICYRTLNINGNDRWFVSVRKPNRRTIFCTDPSLKSVNRNHKVTGCKQRTRHINRQQQQ